MSGLLDLERGLRGQHSLVSRPDACRIVEACPENGLRAAMALRLPPKLDPATVKQSIEELLTQRRALASLGG